MRQASLCPSAPPLRGTGKAPQAPKGVGGSRCAVRLPWSPLSGPVLCLALDPENLPLSTRLPPSLLSSTLPTELLDVEPSLGGIFEERNWSHLACKREDSGHNAIFPFYWGGSAIFLRFQAGKVPSRDSNPVPLDSSSKSLSISHRCFYREPGAPESPQHLKPGLKSGRFPH